MQKIMGIDYGDARTGVAISDLLCSIVGSTYVVPSRNTEKAIADIVRLAKENLVGEIVVGLPKNMDGTEGNAGTAQHGEHAQILNTGVQLVTGHLRISARMPPLQSRHFALMACLRVCFSVGITDPPDR